MERSPSGGEGEARSRNARSSSIVEAFDSGGADVLAGAVRESLPRVERSIAKFGTILQELERVASQDAPATRKG